MEIKELTITLHDGDGSLLRLHVYHVSLNDKIILRTQAKEELGNLTYSELFLLRGSHRYGEQNLEGHASELIHVLRSFGSVLLQTSKWMRF